MSGPGDSGTKGAIGRFFIGLVLASVGAYLFLDRITVTGGTWGFGGASPVSFGVTLIPIAAGIALLFFDLRSKLGWLLLTAAALVMVVGLLVNLHLHFRATTLFHTIAMITFVAAGAGLMLRAMFAAGDARARDEERTAARKVAEGEGAPKRPAR